MIFVAQFSQLVGVLPVDICTELGQEIHPTTLLVSRESVTNLLINTLLSAIIQKKSPKKYDSKGWQSWHLDRVAMNIGGPNIAELRLLK